MFLDIRSRLEKSSGKAAERYDLRRRWEVSAEPISMEEESRALGYFKVFFKEVSLKLHWYFLFPQASIIVALPTQGR